MSLIQRCRYSRKKGSIVKSLVYAALSCVNTYKSREPDIVWPEKLNTYYTEMAHLQTNFKKSIEK